MQRSANVPEATIGEIKEQAAAMIDRLQSAVAQGGEAARCAELAQYHYEIASMFAVKAFTTDPELTELPQNPTYI